MLGAIPLPPHIDPADHLLFLERSAILKICGSVCASDTFSYVVEALCVPFEQLHQWKQRRTHFRKLIGVFSPSSNTHAALQYNSFRPMKRGTVKQIAAVASACTMSKELHHVAWTRFPRKVSRHISICPDGGRATVSPSKHDSPDSSLMSSTALAASGPKATISPIDHEKRSMLACRWNAEHVQLVPFEHLKSRK